MGTGVLGIDIGSVNVKTAWRHPTSGAREIPTGWAPAHGRPLFVLEELIKSKMGEHIGAGPLCISLTGVGQDLMRDLVPAARTNEVVATAMAVADSFPGTRTVIEVGGQFTKWILLDHGKVADFALNGLCAAGSGAFLEQQAARLALTAAEMGRLAAGAARGATVAGRCSVFAKSDMIHLQQKGTPVEEIAYGVCLALARTFAATVLRSRSVEPPVVLVGGGAANPGLVRALCEVLSLRADDLIIPDDHLTVGARGAILAARSLEPLRPDQLVAALAARSRTSEREGTGQSGGLASLRRWTVLTGSPDEDPPRRGIGKVEAYLGVDVGSVSTNLVLLDRKGDVIQGIYLPTRGRPIEVLDEGLGMMAGKFGNDLKVLAVGTTGSGRHLAARALGADTVKNEITAQMTSAARYFPEVDTVFEIGGQDSKYIGARDGRLSAFEMNKICAAGTGSFLEEQAERLGVEIKGDFSDLATAAEHPNDMGSRCTVFMDTELVRAQQRSVPLSDICAGLAYSIARNYLEKVVGCHPVGTTVVFQGGTASNQAVVAAMRALTGKRIVVHPYNRISGAIGAALLAARDHRHDGLPTAFRGFDSCKGARTRSFECARCPNRCQVTRVEIGGLVSHFGDTCERYSERDGRASRGATVRVPDLFAAREDALQRHLPAARRGRPRAVIPRASHVLELAPFWAAVLDELGYNVSLTAPSTLDLISTGSAGLPAEVCLPIKIASGHVRAALGGDADVVVFPSVMELPDPAGDGATSTCFYSQEIPHLLVDAGRGATPRLVVPQCSMSATRGGVREVVEELVRLLGVGRRSAWRAVRRGMETQRRFDKDREAIGLEALGRHGSRCVIVLGRPYNLHDPLLNLDLARRLRRLGLPAIPMDLLPLSRERLGARHDRLMWRYSRDQLRALELVGQHRGVFPIWVSSFGCGPDAFAFKHLEGGLSSRPSLKLEFDEHRGEAGLVTRLEAFIDEIDEHLASDAPRSLTRRRRDRTPPPFSGRVFIPYLSDHVHASAATFRASGFEATVLPPPDAHSVKLGEEHSTGGECHPWVIVAGDLVRWVTSGEAMRGDGFYYPEARNPCLIHQYGDAHRALLERLGLADQAHIWTFSGAGLINLLGGDAALLMYEGFAAIDLLISAACCRRPYERTPGAVDRVHAGNIRLVCEAIEARERAASAVAHGLARLLEVPVREGERRPVVGVCGDLYTRSNAVGNADLFARLEAMGCQVWAHPYLSGLVDTGTRFHHERWAARGQLKPSLLEFLTSFGSGLRSERLRRTVPDELARYCLNPPPDEVRRRAAVYLGRRTNNILVDPVAKMVDFATGGADGIISAVGIGCMMGVVADGVMNNLRRDYPGLPMVTLAYGCTEGPSQRVKLETFVHQVHERAKRPRE
jgi:predicted CoA-substrate-specific enzyme activase